MVQQGQTKAIPSLSATKAIPLVPLLFVSNCLLAKPQYIYSPGICVQAIIPAPKGMCAAASSLGVPVDPHPTFPKVSLPKGKNKKKVPYQRRATVERYKLSFPFPSLSIILRQLKVQGRRQTLSPTAQFGGAERQRNP